MERKHKTKTWHLSSKSDLPIHRSINGIGVLTRHASMKGIDIALLVADSGIQLDDLDNPDVLVTPEQEIIVIQNIIKLLPYPGLGLEIGKQYHIGIHGKLGAVATSSATFLDAIESMFQFDMLLLTYFHYNFEAKGNFVHMILKELIDLGDVRQFVCEREFASDCRIAMDLVGIPFKLEEVHFAYPKPKHAPSYQDFFQCPIIFSAENHRLVFDKCYLQTPLQMENPLANRIYVNECKALVGELKKQNPISKKIIQKIQHNKDIILSLDQLAYTLSMSPRTLRRRLEKEGTSYKELVSEFQKKRVIKLLETTTLSIEQIAAEIGYSDVPNLYRAFKRWTGKNPGSYRVKIESR